MKIQPPTSEPTLGRKVPIPANETRRLDRLRALGVLDTPSDEAFDRITRLVAGLLGVPIALVTLVDIARQWFKSRVGLDIAGTQRDVAFCAHTICHDEVMVVEDATRDDRFALNPLVTGSPNIRFYAGAPLRTADGLNVGTLCAIDRVPRRLGEVERALLRDLAGVVSDQLKLTELAHRARDAERRLTDAVEALPDGFVLFDRDDRLVMCNQRYRDIYSASGDVIRPGVRFEDLLRHGVASGQFPSARGHEEAWIAERMVAHRDPPSEAIDQELAGDRWLRIRERRTSDGGLVGFRIDVTELKRQQRELSVLAWTDSLTGVLNRHRFLQLTEVELKRSQREGTATTLLMLDIDHFKEINDAYGHAVGDDVLKALVSRWRRALRDHDLLGRLGGDEFVVLLPNSTPARAEIVAERLRRYTAAKPVEADGQAVRVSLSAGVTTCVNDPSLVPVALARADAALYAAKVAGRDRVERRVA